MNQTLNIFAATALRDLYCQPIKEDND
uniref:Uncharacterized protein n=1 Tax=Musa acuminata subsp. malaccensis TaxID=214687 RepID=A0A804IQB3_MUSAM